MNLGKKPVLDIVNAAAQVVVVFALLIKGE
jgi:hypothetical protein